MCPRKSGQLALVSGTTRFGGGGQSRQQLTVAGAVILERFADESLHVADLLSTWPDRLFPASSPVVKYRATRTALRFATNNMCRVPRSARSPSKPLARPIFS